ncbi:hypothetical protein SO802_032297 [Lithocarpus litseifolius]|uniref:F-box associated domain-containing protein n=1 Tax=Lithocarpus litseifolius TaxID=425828 RepID=A0AAW2BMQ7_9ROSI
MVVEVYSLSTGEWRMLSASASLPPLCGILIYGPQAFANEALNLIAVTYDKKPSVLVFDLGDEVFYHILLPELPWKMVWICVFVYGNSITGFQKRVGGVGFRRNGEIVLRNNRGGLVLWNPDTQKIKYIEINGFCCTLVGSYVESLVFLDKASNSVFIY